MLVAGHAAIQSASASQSDYQNFAKTLGDNLTNVDVAAVTAQISTYTAQLEAAYSAISKIQGLDLTSYLRCPSRQRFAMARCRWRRGALEENLLGRFRTGWQLDTSTMS